MSGLHARRRSSARCACARIRSSVAWSNVKDSDPSSSTRSTKPAVLQIFTSVLIWALDPLRLFPSTDGTRPASKAGRLSAATWTLAGLAFVLGGRAWGAGFGILALLTAPLILAPAVAEAAARLKARRPHATRPADFPPGG
jgi:hypothetical protein